MSPNWSIWYLAHISVGKAIPDKLLFFIIFIKLKPLRIYRQMKYLTFYLWLFDNRNKFLQLFGVVILF